MTTLGPRRLAPLALLPLTLTLGSLPSSSHDEVKPIRPSLAGPAYSAAAWGRGGGYKAGVGFASSNAVLLARIPNQDVGTSVTSDCWGYVSPSGREYVLWCHFDGTHFVEVTYADAPVVVGYVPGPSSGWRDAKVYQDHAYIVSEGGDGIQVVDLSAIDSGVVTHVGDIETGPSGTDTHNVAIDTTSGFLYRCGGTSSDGLRIYDLSTPSSPAYVGMWADRYVHDVQVITYESGPFEGRQIAFCCSGFNGGSTDTGLSIVDVTDKTAPVHRGQVTWPGAAYSHQGWLSDDLQTFLVDDEQDEFGALPTTIYQLDVSDIDNPTYAGSFTNGNPATGHNLYVKGDLVYAANYTSGLRVFDLESPGGPAEVAWLDTYPDNDSTGYSGLWSVYPYLPSGVVACSDKSGGLFLVWVGPEPLTFSFPGGNPALLDADSAAVQVQIDETAPGDLLPGSAKLFYDAGAGFVEVALNDLGGGSFEAPFGPLPCGNNVAYYVTAQSSTGVTWVDPPNGGTYVATATRATAFAFQDDFDTDLGWTVGAPDDDAIEGLWERVDPNGTLSQPEDDYDPVGGGMCWVTMQGEPLKAAPHSDVDGGKTTLTSPPIDLSTPGDYYVSFRRWYTNELFNFPFEDVFLVQVSSDGTSWVTVDTVGPDGPRVGLGWRHFQFRVADFVPLSASVQVRFVASDYGGESLVEAAIDDFAVLLGPCPDCSEDGESDDIQLLDGTIADLDLDGAPDICEGLSADKLVLSTLLGGSVAFELSAPDSQAGQLYLLLGSLTGMEPGFDVGAVHVPLNQDVYFGYTLAQAGSPPLVNSFGVLDGSGDAAASFVLSPGFFNLVGLQAHHAWMAIHPFTLEVTYASHALPLSFNF